MSPKLAGQHMGLRMSQDERTARPLVLAHTSHWSEWESDFIKGRNESTVEQHFKALGPRDLSVTGALGHA